MEGQPATEAPLGPKALTFHIPCTQETEGDHCYQRPILPTQNHWVALLSPWQQQHLLKQTHLYIRTFCAGLCGFTFILLLCMSPMSWVQFLLADNGLELYAGLWTLCGHELCWSHVPSAPYYLQISRIFFLLSVFTAFIILAWVIRSCRDRKEPSTHLDQGVAILSLTSASLLICLVLFLMQVKKYTSYNMESSYLWIFYFNWWGSFFYVVVGELDLHRVVAKEEEGKDRAQRQEAAWEITAFRGRESQLDHWHLCDLMGLGFLISKMRVGLDA
uniref:Transmembrane protein 202 n=1 Tax=Vombatus ursinus TaxID=29139 RepID=A0A4X2L4P9_VOMUR